MARGGMRSDAMGVKRYTREVAGTCARRTRAEAMDMAQTRRQKLTLAQQMSGVG